MRVIASRNEAIRVSWLSVAWKWPEGEGLDGAPKRIRTAVTGVKGQRPGPLDDGGT